MVAVADGDPVWADDIRRRLDEQARDQMRTIIEEESFQPLLGSEALMDAPMPLEDNFRQLIAEHKASSFEAFVVAALAAELANRHG